MIKPLIVSQSDLIGGAAKAAFRLHQNFVKNDIESRMLVRVKKSSDWRVEGPRGVYNRLYNSLRPHLTKKINQLIKTNNKNYHSSCWLPSNLSKIINEADADIVNMHWIGAETISMTDIKKIKKPIIWTLHDMWLFCGMEHYAPDKGIQSWKNGYKNEPFFDLNRITWRKKLKSIKESDLIITPSQWLADCCLESELLRKNEICIIPNIVNTNLFRKIDKSIAREILGLPNDAPILLFGAIGGTADQRKGFHHLYSSINNLKRKIRDDFICLVFGQNAPKNPIDFPCKINYLGHIYDEITLSLIYNSADLMITPSMQENLPQTATEAQCCGTPVVAFNTTGLTDVILHKETGYLAEPFETEDLAEGICWILNDEQRAKQLSNNAEKRAKKLWSSETIIPKYMEAYKSRTR